MNSASPYGHALSGAFRPVPRRSGSHRLARVAPLAIALQGLLTGSSAFAQTTQWLGGAGNWEDSAKWTSGVPSAGQEARFNQSAATHDVSIQSAAVASLLEIRRNRVNLQLSGGSSLSISGAVNIGNIGTANTPASLHITGPASGTATVSATAFTLGLTSGATFGGNEITLSGDNLSVTGTSSRSVIGRLNNQNSFTITNGADLDLHSLRVGGFDGATGNSLLVNGAGSRVRVLIDTVEIGAGSGNNASNNTVSATNGGLFETSKNVLIGQISGASLNGVSINGAGSEFRLTQGASLSIGSATPVNAGGNYVELASGGLLSTNGQITLYGYNAAQPNSGRNRLTIKSGGTLTQAEDNSQKINVRAGALLDLQTGGNLQARLVEIESGARFTAAGTGLLANTSIASGGALSVGPTGETANTLSVSRQFDFLTGSTLELDLFAGGFSDSLNLLSGGTLNIASGATLLVSLVDFTPTSADSWTLFTGDTFNISGTFSLVLPGLSGGLSWDTSSFNEAGGWELRAIPEPGETALFLCGAALAAIVVRRRKIAASTASALLMAPLITQAAIGKWELTRADTAEGITALCFSTGQPGVAVSSGGATFQLNDDGWSKLAPDAPLGGKGAVRGCAWTTEGQLWIGSAGLSREARGIFSLQENRWSQQEMTGIVNPRINGMWKASEGEVLLVAMAKGQIARWDGNTWSVANLRRPNDFTAIHGSDLRNIWAVGDGGLLFQSDDGGVTWMDVPVPDALQGAKWQSIYALAANRVWMVGREGEIGFWDGSEVHVQSLSTPRILRGVLAVSDTEVYIVGSATGPKTPGLLMRSAGNGVWEKVETGLSGYGTLNTIAQDTAGTLYVAGNEGAILKGTGE